MFIILDENDKL